MNPPQCPVAGVEQVRVNVTYLLRLLDQKRIPRDAAKKVLEDTEALLDSISLQLQQRNLT